MYYLLVFLVLLPVFQRYSLREQIQAMVTVAGPGVYFSPHATSALNQPNTKRPISPHSKPSPIDKLV